MEVDSDLKLRAACASSPSRACISFHRLDPERPKSAILTWDEAEARSWSRTDVSRNIVSVCAAPNIGGYGYVALSDEGDVVVPGAGIASRIPGAGIFSDDATGLGALAAIGYEERHGFLACGMTAQAYQSHDLETWHPLKARPRNDPPGGVVHFSTVAFAPDNTIWLGGSRAYPRLASQIDAEAEALGAGNIDLFMQLSLAAAREDTGVLVRLSREAEWETDHELASPVTALGFEGDTLIAGCSSGQIFRDDTVDGITQIATGATEEILALAVGDGILWAATPGGLFSVGAPQDFPLLHPAPVDLQTMDDALWYFDATQGMFRNRAGHWKNIRVPADLLFGL